IAANPSLGGEGCAVTTDAHLVLPGASEPDWGPADPPAARYAPPATSGPAAPAAPAGQTPAPAAKATHTLRGGGAPRKRLPRPSGAGPPHDPGAGAGPANPAAAATTKAAAPAATTPTTTTPAAAATGPKPTQAAYIRRADRICLLARGVSRRANEVVSKAFAA